ncbi:MAG: branched-chain amino acid aminotransferase [Deltaproteobacteria bacterium]|nr:branched-chain amino acid aminotransferase [Deltaproteobacteria bacterium]
MKTEKNKKADLDWKNLPFGYIETDFNIRYHYKDGAWSKGELTSDTSLKMHIADPCLHYGQEAFEGMKAFETKDGRIVVFRPIENAKRLQVSSDHILIPKIPAETFLDGIQKVVAANARFVPPYGTGASLYIRPVVFGVGAQIGLGPAREYEFVIFVMPVGPYYKGGFKPVKALIVEEFDRAAPLGMGAYKVGANYAAGLLGYEYAHQQGYPIALYLDPKEKRYIDEFSTSNFIAIAGTTYITPKSRSVLPSITNDSLAIMAADMGMAVEKRPIDVEELKNFDEVGAVGTAAVITPIASIQYKDRAFTYGDGASAGPVSTKLYEKLTKIQTGEIDDPFGWLEEINL